MAASAVGICSNALLLLGAQSISSFVEDNDRALLASNLYPTIKDATLRAHPWNCAVKRVALAPDAAAPAFDFSYQFSLPHDWLRTLQVGEYGREDVYRSEGRKLLADVNPLYLRYIADVSEGDFDTQLVQVLTLQMAAAMAYPITKSAALSESLLRQASLALKQAQAIDGQDDPPETLGDERLYGAGFSSRGW